MSDMSKHMSPNPPIQPSITWDDPEKKILSAQSFPIESCGAGPAVFVCSTSSSGSQSEEGPVLILVLMIRCDGTECLMDERAQPQILVSHRSIIAPDGYIKPARTSDHN